MTRLRPAGSFSKRNCSPWWKRIGGVDRSTSSTNPGRGIRELRSQSGPLLLVAEVERDLHGAAGTGVGGVDDGLVEAGEGIARADQPPELLGLHELEREVEGAAAADRPL